MNSAMEKMPGGPPDSLPQGMRPLDPPPPYIMLKHEAPRPRPRSSWMTHKMFLVFLTLIAAVIICTCIFVIIYIVTSHHHSKSETEVKPTRHPHDKPEHPVWEFHLDAVYQNERLKHAIRFDMENKLMLVDVPMTRVTNESSTLHDFTKGYLAVRSPFWRRCLIQPMREDFDGIVRQMRDWHHHKVPLRVECVQRIIGEEVPSERIADLGPHIHRHCHGVKTYWMSIWDAGADAICSGRCWGMGMGRYCYNPYN